MVDLQIAETLCDTNSTLEDSAAQLYSHCEIDFEQTRSKKCRVIITKEIAETSGTVVGQVCVEDKGIYFNLRL